MEGTPVLTLPNDSIQCHTLVFSNLTVADTTVTRITHNVSPALTNFLHFYTKKFLSQILSYVSHTKKGLCSNLQCPSLQLGYKDSNLEMTESESVALPFGDSPMSQHNVLYYRSQKKASTFLNFFKFFFISVCSCFLLPL